MLRSRAIDNAVDILGRLPTRIDVIAGVILVSVCGMTCPSLAMADAAIAPGSAPPPGRVAVTWAILGVIALTAGGGLGARAIRRQVRSEQDGEESESDA